MTHLSCLNMFYVFRTMCGCGFTLKPLGVGFVVPKLGRDMQCDVWRRMVAMTQSFGVATVRVKANRFIKCCKTLPRVFDAMQL